MYKKRKLLDANFDTRHSLAYIKLLKWIICCSGCWNTEREVSVLSTALWFFILRNASTRSQTKHIMQRPKQSAQWETKADISPRVRAPDLAVLQTTRQLEIPAIFRIAYGNFTIAVQLWLKCLLTLSLYTPRLSKSRDKKPPSTSIQTLAKWRGAICSCHLSCRPSFSKGEAGT